MLGRRCQLVRSLMLAGQRGRVAVLRSLGLAATVAIVILLCISLGRRYVIICVLLAVDGFSPHMSCG
jgi:hypothetical protein